MSKIMKKYDGFEFTGSIQYFIDSIQVPKKKTIKKTCIFPTKEKSRKRVSRSCV